MINIWIRKQGGIAQGDVEINGVEVFAPSENMAQVFFRLFDGWTDTSAAVRDEFGRALRVGFEVDVTPDALFTALDTWAADTPRTAGKVWTPAEWQEFAAERIERIERIAPRPMVSMKDQKFHMPEVVEEEYREKNQRAVDMLNSGAPFMIHYYEGPDTDRGEGWDIEGDIDHCSESTFVVPYYLCVAIRDGATGLVIPLPVLAEMADVAQWVFCCDSAIPARVVDMALQEFFTEQYAPLNLSWVDERVPGWPVDVVEETPVISPELLARLKNGNLDFYTED